MSKISCWLLVEDCFQLNEATGSFLPHDPHLRPSVFMADCFFKAKKGEPHVLARQELDPCIVTLFGEGNGNPLQYSCLENPRDKGPWWATVQWGCKELDTTEWLTHTSTHSHPNLCHIPLVRSKFQVPLPLKVRFHKSWAYGGQLKICPALCKMETSYFWKRFIR